MALVDAKDTSQPGITDEAIETLLWLAESKGIDRRRYRVVNRLRSVQESEEFATLPEDLRARVREVIADSPP